MLSMGMVFSLFVRMWSIKAMPICEIIVALMIMNTDILCLYKMYNMNEWVCYFKKPFFVNSLSILIQFS